jgi:hypothetical protein
MTVRVFETGLAKFGAVEKANGSLENGRTCVLPVLDKEI